MDGYDRPEPFDSARDEPTDEYLEGFAFWGLAYLDAQSWRHYLPRLIDYALRRPDDPAMVAEALVRSLRPPDRYPPRLASLSAEQEAVVTAFLEHVALGEATSHVARRCAAGTGRVVAADPAQPAHTLSRLQRHDRSLPYGACATAGCIASRSPRHSQAVACATSPKSRAAWRPGAATFAGRPHGRRGQRLTSRCALACRRRGSAVGALPQRPDASPRRRPRRAPGARLDGLTHGDSPAEPQVLTLLFAEDGKSLVTLSIRAWPRDDVAGDVERIVSSFELPATGPAT